MKVSANPVKLVKRQWTRRRRRRKGHGWSKQSANKKKLAAAAKTLPALQAEPVSAPECSVEPSTEENSPVKKKLIQKKNAKQSVEAPTSNSTASASDTITSSLPSDSATAPAIAVPPSTHSTASATTQRTPPPSNPRTAPARALSDSSQTEPDLCIAAYVTLAVNGESCDEQEATIKQIAQLPTPSPEADQPSVLLAHEIELATSNVPVYLLNGESRDVTTPVPPVSSVSASACDDAASEQ